MTDPTAGRAPLLPPTRWERMGLPIQNQWLAWDENGNCYYLAYIDGHGIISLTDSPDHGDIAKGRLLWDFYDTLGDNEMDIETFLLRVSGAWKGN